MRGLSTIASIFLLVFIFSACGHKAPPKPPEDKKVTADKKPVEDKKAEKK